MAKSNRKQRTKKTQIKKNSVNKKIDSMDSKTINEVLNVLKVLFIVIVIFSVFYLITVLLVGRDSSDKKVETQIQYDEILAGSSFSMNSKEYMVIYYDFTDSELSNLTSTISNYIYSGKIKLYLVNMNNGFNKEYVAEENSNTSPKTVNELAIKGPTLIKISNGNVIDYVEGQDNIISYLK